MLTSLRPLPNLTRVPVPEPAAPPAESSSRLSIPLTRRGWPELVALAFIHRLVIALWTTTIATDCTRYLPSAESFRQGRYWEGLDTDLHPLYPLLTGLLARVTGDVDLSGVVVALTAGALVPIPLFLLVKKLWNERVAWFAGFLYALQPILALDTSEAYPTSLFLLTFFSAAACGVHAVSTPRWYLYPLAGVFAALSYLTRTEGIHAVVFLGLGTAWVLGAVLLRKWRGMPLESAPRDRLKFAGGILSAVILFFLVCLPYLAFVREKLGRWALTTKGGQTLLDKALKEENDDDDENRSVQRPPTGAEAVARHESVGRYVGKKYAKALFGPLIPFYVLGFFCVRRQEGRWRRIAPLLLMSLVALVPPLLLLALAPNHLPSHRYMVLSGMLLLPWAAAAALTLGDLLTAPGRTVFLRTWGWGLVLAIFLILLPIKSLGPRRAAERTYLEAGSWLREQDLRPPRVLVSTDAKLAYYGRCANAQVPSQWTDPDNPPPALKLRGDYAKGLDPETALEWARRARREFDRTGGSLLALDQKAVDRFFGAEYLKQLEAVGFRLKKKISPESGEKALTIWLFALETP